MRISEVRSLVTEISATTESQAANLQQVNSAVGDMDRSTQQNAAMVAQSTAAARSLASAADPLARLVNGFNIGGGAVPEVRMRVRTRRVAFSRVTGGIGHRIPSTLQSASTVRYT